MIGWRQKGFLLWLADDKRLQSSNPKANKSLQSPYSRHDPAARYTDSGVALMLVSDVHWALFFDENEFVQSATISHISTGLQG
jgi:hypothetical protein